MALDQDADEDLGPIAIEFETTDDDDGEEEEGAEDNNAPSTSNDNDDETPQPGAARPQPQQRTIARKWQ
jgi:hypothetical protein